MIRLVSLPFCQVVMLDRWDAPARRSFTAYAARGSARWLMGHPVVDEFATISSPVFLTPRALLGKIYDVGISLGHLRDHEMAVDSGWPPLCVGVDLPAPELGEDWDRQLLRAIVDPDGDGWSEERMGSLTARRTATYEVEAFRLADASVVAVSAPLLPRQLERVCEATSTPLTVAISVGNRIERSDEGRPLSVQVASEAGLEEILKTVKDLV